MKHACFRLCLALLTAATLTGCGSTAGYKGPSLKFGIGYEGIDLSVTLIGKAPAPSLTEAGKTPIPPAP
jgi:hypothetical protein